MKFTIAIASIFLSISTLVSAARVTSRGGCEGSQVTGTSTVTHEGAQINIVTGSCPSSGGAKRSTLQERQYSLCSEGTCTATCENTSYYTIYASDCEYLFAYLATYGSTYTYIAAATYQEWNYGSCAIVFWNLDIYDYEVCYAEVAYDAALIGADCYGYTNGAICTGSGLTGDAYEITIQSP